MICLDNYEATDRVRRLPCFHVFHAKCIDKYFKGKKTCPICHAEV